MLDTAIMRSLIDNLTIILYQMVFMPYNYIYEDHLTMLDTAIMRSLIDNLTNILCQMFFTPHDKI